MIMSVDLPKIKKRKSWRLVIEIVLAVGAVVLLVVLKWIKSS